MKKFAAGLFVGWYFAQPNTMLVKSIREMCEKLEAHNERNRR